MNEINIENKVITITNPSRMLFPRINITKWDLVNYYLKIADYILPYIRDRSLTIYCFPEGVENDGVYHQCGFENLPVWFQTISLKNKAGEYNQHILCQDKASLIYLVNHNMISIFRSLHKVDSFLSPDILAINISASTKKLNLACKAARLLKIRLEDSDYNPLLMITGSADLQVLSIVKEVQSYKQVHSLLNKLVEQIIKEYFTLESVTFDITCNDYDQSVIAPFSIIADKKASVATPLSWEELDEKELSANKYNINNIFKRLDDLKKDPWDGL